MLLFPVKNNAPGIWTSRNNKTTKSHYCLPLLPKHQINKCVPRSMEITNKVSVAEIPGWHSLLYSEIHMHSLKDEVIRKGNQRKKALESHSRGLWPPKKEKVERRKYQGKNRGK